MEAEKNQIDNIRMEYTAIRDEIILLMNEQNMHITNLYIMSITILGLGYTLQKSALFLLLYLIILPFQVLVNNKEYMMVRCGVYIKKYIEPKIGEAKWEQRIHKVDKAFNHQYKFKLGKFQIENRICDYGAFIFSCVALCSYTVYNIEVKNNVVIFLTGFSKWGIIIAFVATIVAYKLCYKGSNYERLSNIFERIIDEEESAEFGKGQGQRSGSGPWY